MTTVLPTPAAPPQEVAAGPLDAILKPRSVAVVGASRTEASIGHQVLANLIRHGFTGAVYPVNPNAKASCGCGSSFSA